MWGNVFDTSIMLLKFSFSTLYQFIFTKYIVIVHVLMLNKIYGTGKSMILYIYLICHVAAQGFFIHDIKKY